MNYAFAKKSYEDHTDFGLPYDFESLMHYSADAFSKIENGSIVGHTIVPIVRKFIK